jgi:hypothetical protein
MKLTVEIKKGYIFPYSDNDREALSTIKDGIYQTDVKNMDMRTTTQNSSLHRLFSLTADALNDAGYSVNTVLNRRKLEAISKVFDWGFEKLKPIANADKVLQKMKDRIVANEEIELTWTMILVKDVIWRPLQIHQTQKESTTKLTKSEIDKVYELFNMVLGRYGIHIPFPNRELWEEKQ